MAIAASGAVSFADLRSEFVGGSSAISFSDLYRGGSNIRAKAANNNGVNLAANVPTSGAIDVSSFRNQAKGFRYTFTAGATDQNASALFGSDYSVNYPKEIVIDSGVELGATSTAEEALEIDSGGAGTITVTNNGTLSGAGGAAGADGGDAFEAAVACTFVNNGTVRAGGGGGGTGGTGGNGYYTTNTNYSFSGSPNCGGTNSFTGWYAGAAFSGAKIKINGTQVASAAYASATATSGYYRSTYRGNFTEDGGVCGYKYDFYSQSTTNTSGGSGGAGAVGAGYSQSAGTGSAGSSGGTNAGSGGSGGNGGAFGSAGSTGATGANGNSSNGSAGSAGGAAGKYLRGLSFVTFTNNGTALGGTA